MPKQDVGELLPYALRCNVGDSVWFYVWYELRSLCTVGRQCIQQMAAPRPEDRLKVVVRGLPPALTREAFVTLIERCCGYTWLAFYPGKSSSKRSVPSCVLRTLLRSVQHFMVTCSSGRVAFSTLQRLNMLHASVYQCRQRGASRLRARSMPVRPYCVLPA